VPNTITGIAQADVAILVLDASPDEAEMSLSASGQAREHLWLARNFGITSLVVAVNKMDDKLTRWSQARFQEVVALVQPMWRAVGFRDEDVTCVPVSGLTGVNLVRSPADRSHWMAGGLREGGAVSRGLSDGGASTSSAGTGATTAGSTTPADEEEDWWGGGAGGGEGRIGGDPHFDAAEMLEDLGFSTAPAGTAAGVARPSDAGALARSSSASSHSSSSSDLTAAVKAAWTEEALTRLTSWYRGPTLLQALCAIKPPARPLDKPLRLAISDVYT